MVVVVSTLLQFHSPSQSTKTAMEHQSQTLLDETQCDEPETEVSGAPSGCGDSAEAMHTPEPSVPFIDLATSPTCKKPRLMSDPPMGVPALKWVDKGRGELIPFVKHPSTGMVHCGHAKMDVYRDGTVFCYDCLNYQCPEWCNCPCHILIDHYKSRAG